MAKFLVEDRDENTKVPFLRGILISSLQDAGLPFKEAYRLASEIRADMGDATSVTTDELRSQVLTRLKALKGETVSFENQIPGGLRLLSARADDPEERYRTYSQRADPRD